MTWIAGVRPRGALRYPPVHLTGRQALDCADGFAEAIRRCGSVLDACSNSILPEHVHVVVARNRQRIERIVRHLKGAAPQQLIREDRHPMRNAPGTKEGPLPSPWARSCWKVFLNDADGIERAIRYVGDNPPKEGKRLQRWTFIRPFER